MMILMMIYYTYNVYYCHPLVLTMIYCYYRIWHFNNITTIHLLHYFKYYILHMKIYLHRKNHHVEILFWPPPYTTSLAQYLSPVVAQFVMEMPTASNAPNTLTIKNASPNGNLILQLLLNL